jgi:hypothetical protein
MSEKKKYTASYSRYWTCKVKAKTKEEWRRKLARGDVYDRVVQYAGWNWVIWDSEGKLVGIGQREGEAPPADGREAPDSEWWGAGKALDPSFQPQQNIIP